MKNKSLFFISSIFLALLLNLILVSAAYPSSLVSFWKFDNSSWLGKDYADSNHGTASGNSAFSSSGQVLGSLDLTNTNLNNPTWINVPRTANLKFGQTYNDFTLEAWIKPSSSSLNSFKGILGMWSDFGLSGGGISLALENGNVLFWTGYNNPSRIIISNTKLTQTDWHYIVLTKSGNTYKIYINGVLDKELSVSNTINYGTSNDDFTIGSDGTVAPLADRFVGKIDEVAIYNKALNASEIQKHYNNSKEGKDYFYVQTPVISNINVSSITNSTAVIIWNTDLLSDSYAEYGTSINNLNNNVFNSSLTLSHSVSLSGLAPNTTYYYSVNSCINPDDDETCSPFSNTLSFTTLANQIPPIPPANDTTAPGKVTNLSIVPGINSILISWTNPSDSDFNGTLVYLDGNLTATLNKNQASYNFTNLVENTTYNIIISTIDTSGNTNPLQIIASTLSVVHNTIIKKVHTTTSKNIYGSELAEIEAIQQQESAGTIRLRGSVIPAPETESESGFSSNYLLFILLLALACLALILLILFLIFRRD